MLASPRCASRLARKFHRLGYTPVPENDITPHFRKCRAVVALKLHLVPHTAARPIGFPKQALCKVAYAGVGRTAVGAPRSRVHALRAAVCTPLWCACTWALVRRCALCAWSVACGQSCGVCPRPPVGLAAARLGSALNCPSAPPVGAPSVSAKPGPEERSLRAAIQQALSFMELCRPTAVFGLQDGIYFQRSKFKVLILVLARCLPKKIRYCLDSGLSLFSLVPER